jgi:hypothetical protein
MGSPSGVNSSFLSRLPDEDKQAIKAGQEARWKSVVEAKTAPPPSSQTSSTMSSDRSFVDRQKDADLLATASPYASQAMQAELNKDVAAAAGRIESLDRDIAALGTSGGYVAEVLRNERNTLATEVDDYDHVINPSTGSGYTDAEVTEPIEQDKAEAQAAADARALAVNDAGGDPQNIINPSTGRGYTDAELRELVAERAGPDRTRDLPERVEVIRADVGGSVGPFAFGNETVYMIEYLPNSDDALVTKYTEAGAGGTGNWRVGGFVDAGGLGEGGVYLGGGVQYVVQRVEGETFRVPADQARDIVNRDATSFANDVGIIGIGISGSNFDQPSPLEAEGILVRTTEGWERDSQADGLAELGIHDADWLGPFESFIGGSLGGEYNYEYTTTTQQDYETGNASVRVDILQSGELDASFLELQDAKADDEPTVFGVDENAQQQSEQYIEIVSNDQGEVVQVIYGKSASNGETLNRTQWILDATDPALAERIQTAMSEGGGATGHGGLAELAEAEGAEQSQSYDISGTSYGGGGDFFPLPDIGVGGSVSFSSESYDTATG